MWRGTGHWKHSLEAESRDRFCDQDAENFKENQTLRMSVFFNKREFGGASLGGNHTRVESRTSIFRKTREINKNSSKSLLTVATVWWKGPSIILLDDSDTIEDSLRKHSRMSEPRRAETSPGHGEERARETLSAHPESLLTGDYRRALNLLCDWKTIFQKTIEPTPSFLFLSP